MTSLIPPRIAALKTVMNKARVDAYIIPTADPHQSEYVPEYWAGRYWISGFHGSAGTVVVTADHAGLWTDSRYFYKQNSNSKEVVSHFINCWLKPRPNIWIGSAVSLNPVRP